jgi:hypothetical protein
MNTFIIIDMFDDKILGGRNYIACREDYLYEELKNHIEKYYLIRKDNGEEGCEWCKIFNPIKELIFYLDGMCKCYNRFENDILSKALSRVKFSYPDLQKYDLFENLNAGGEDKKTYILTYSFISTLENEDVYIKDLLTKPQMNALFDGNSIMSGKRLINLEKKRFYTFMGEKKKGGRIYTYFIDVNDIFEFLDNFIDEKKDVFSDSIMDFESLMETNFNMVESEFYDWHYIGSCKVKIYRPTSYTFIGSTKKLYDFIDKKKFIDMFLDKKSKTMRCNNDKRLFPLLNNIMGEKNRDDIYKHRLLLIKKYALDN